MLLVLFLTCQCKPKDDFTYSQFVGKPFVPSSIKETHDDLLKKIHQLTTYKGKGQSIAKELEELMLYHFKEEEDFILPPLSLLPSLASGQIPAQSKELIILIDKMTTKMNYITAEHQKITVLIDKLKLVAAAENMAEIIEFEKEINMHSTNKEELFFPSVILIGEYLKLKAEVKH